jgi:hypothetical protein
MSKLSDVTNIRSIGAAQVSGLCFLELVWSCLTVGKAQKGLKRPKEICAFADGLMLVQHMKSL